MAELERKQVTFISDIIPIIDELAKSERRSFANMAEVLMREAIKKRETITKQQKTEEDQVNHCFD